MPLFLLLLTLAAPDTSWMQADTTYHDGSLVIRNYTRIGVTIASWPGPFGFIYSSENPPEVGTIGARGGYRYLINASFFDGMRAHATHAGWLFLRGDTVAPLRKDRQLTRVVRYDMETGTVCFCPLAGFQSAGDSSSVEFQTGPEVIEQDTVTEAEIAGSVNGLGSYTRTLLAVTNGSVKYFITVRKRYRLNDLARVLLSLDVFRGTILDAVDLDGGPSVALWSRDHPELNYNVGDHLPLLLGIR